MTILGVSKVVDVEVVNWLPLIPTLPGTDSITGDPIVDTTFVHHVAFHFTWSGNLGSVITFRILASNNGVDFTTLAGGMRDISGPYTNTTSDGGVFDNSGPGSGSMLIVVKAPAKYLVPKIDVSNGAVVPTGNIICRAFGWSQ